MSHPESEGPESEIQATPVIATELAFTAAHSLPSPVAPQVALAGQHHGEDLRSTDQFPAFMLILRPWRHCKSQSVSTTNRSKGIRTTSWFALSEKPTVQFWAELFVRMSKPFHDSKSIRWRFLSRQSQRL